MCITYGVLLLLVLLSLFLLVVVVVFVLSLLVLLCDGDSIMPEDCHLGVRLLVPI